jgi:hypothetical protein
MTILDPVICDFYDGYTKSVYSCMFSSSSMTAVDLVLSTFDTVLYQNIVLLKCGSD